jgi:uncharacterized protein (TIGR03382 family)
MIKPAILLSFAVAALDATPARATQCSRWNNILGPCDGIVDAAICNNTQDSWPRPSLQSYYNWVYSSTPQKACRKQVLKTVPEDADSAVAIEIDDSLWACFYDWDDDGSTWANEGGEDDDGDLIDDDDYSSITLMTLQTNIEREPECDLIPQGPYTNANPGHPRPVVRPMGGGKFSNDQRYWVKDENILKYGSQQSDAHPLSTPQTNIGDSQAIWLTRFTLQPYEDDAEIDDPMQLPNFNGTLQIDHIIPRIDIHGCKCGTNGYNNAAAISTTLNNKMSNNMRDPDRIKMLQAFVPGYVPPSRTVGEEDEPRVDEVATTVDEVGGCSATGSKSTSSLALLALALLWTQRRRRQ